MPTIQFKLQELNNLLDKKINLAQLKELLIQAKAEYDGEQEEKINIKFNDTNQPYLWGVEGLSRLLKGLQGTQKGLPVIKVKKSNAEVKVDNSVKKIRPFIVSFLAKGKKIDEDLLLQLIQLQEKLSENYGRKRAKIAIGIYPSKKISFPVTYKAANPETKFTPLDFNKELSLKQILEEHPKGKEYAHILKNFDKYPILVDSTGKVLSFPPIINSETTGKVTPGEEELFFEATGTDQKSLNLVCNIFAYALNDQGFSIEQVKTDGELTPELKTTKTKITKEQVKELLGLDLSEKEIKTLLEKMGYNYSSGIIEIPSYRTDIMNTVDIIEDIAIAYGYENIPSEPLKTQTIGKTLPITKFINNIRQLMVGLGYQETFSAVLNNKNNLYEKMNTQDFGTIEIKDYMSETYSVIRSWMLPILMEVLSKNQHNSYPQKIFEQGLTSTLKNGKASDQEKISFATAHTKSDFTEVKQAIDLIFRLLQIDYSIEETKHTSFIQGRTAKIIVHDKEIGILGEIHPQTLQNWQIEMPVVACEINLTELFELGE
ncbi:phenylalanine--tRNA ligase subunit beta [Candidatus Woesearchaeota archaeon]|nr:phenylalanine--tRNA ligase subunit beta [Candidatus Woesearchaeota archaeon]